MKLFASDIQALRSESAFLSQHIYFHLNHPIRYVRIVGVIVGITEINLRYTVLTLDDGSGATIEVKIIRRTANEYAALESQSQPVSNTTISNLHIISQLGRFEILVDGEEIDIGTAVKAKCTISEFRGEKQLEMKRVWVVKSTDEEARNWRETAVYKKEVLSTPWHITREEHRRIKKEIKLERKRNTEYERLKAEHEVKERARQKEKEEYLKKREAKLEARRRKETVMMNAGALI